jgi:hypothetical protein
MISRRGAEALGPGVGHLGPTSRRSVLGASCHCPRNGWGRRRAAPKIEVPGFRTQAGQKRLVRTLAPPLAGGGLGLCIG